MSDREIALRILEKIERYGAFASLLLERESRGMTDPNFVRTIVLGVLRWRSSLDYAIEKISGRRLSKIDAPAVQILRLGIYQLWFMNVAPHAAVSETVNLAGRRFPRVRGFVNAVLRRAAESSWDAMRPEGSSPADVAVRTGHPETLIHRWRGHFGPARAEAIAFADQELSYPDLLVNTARIDEEAAHHLLTSRGVKFERSPLLPAVFRLKESTAAVALEIEQGLFHAMDEGSIAVATLMPRECRRLLDMSAAPGGKSIVLSLRGHELVSHDLSLGRLAPLRTIFPRITGRRARLVVGDGRQPVFRQRFDGVLLDAPCSATGTLRKNPEVKWRMESCDFDRFASTQRELLDRALDLTRDFCLYATCSLEPEENEHVIDALLARRSDFARFDLASIAPPGLLAWIEDGMLRLTPEAGSDGFHAIGLRRK